MEITPGARLARPLAATTGSESVVSDLAGTRPPRVAGQQPGAAGQAGAGRSLLTELRLRPGQGSSGAADANTGAQPAVDDPGPPRDPATPREPGPGATAGIGGDIGDVEGGGLGPRAEKTGKTGGGTRPDPAALANELLAEYDRNPTPANADRAAGAIEALTDEQLEANPTLAERRNGVQRAAEELRLDRWRRATAETQTGRDLLRFQEQADIKVVVLSDAEYDERYEGSAGVWDSGGPSGEAVYVPQRSLADPYSNILVHELTHALDSKSRAIVPEGSDDDRSQEEVIAEAEAYYREIGIDPADVRPLVEGTYHASDDGALLSHAHTKVTEQRTELERAGITREQSEGALAEGYEANVRREMVLKASRGHTDGEVSTEEYVGVVLGDDQREAWLDGDTAEREAIEAEAARVASEIDREVGNPLGTEAFGVQLVNTEAREEQLRAGDPDWANEQRGIGDVVEDVIEAIPFF